MSKSKAIHLIPTAQVFLGMIPVYVAVSRPGVARRPAYQRVIDTVSRFVPQPPRKALP